MIVEENKKFNEVIEMSTGETVELKDSYCCLHRDDGRSNSKCAKVDVPSHGKFVIMKINKQIRELQTVLRDK